MSGEVSGCVVYSPPEPPDPRTLSCSVNTWEFKMTKRKQKERETTKNKKKPEQRSSPRGWHDPRLVACDRHHDQMIEDQGATELCIPDMSSSWNVYLPFKKIRNMMTIPASWTMAHLRSVPTRLAHWVTLRLETLSKYHHPS